MQLGPTLAFVNGKVLTLDASDKITEAVAVAGNRLVAVGTTSEIRHICRPETTLVDLDGRTLMPGLVDPHVHLISTGDDGSKVECRDFYDSSIRSVADILARLREAGRRAEPGEWVVGNGSPMQDMRLEERRWPTREEIDQACPDNPAYVTFGAHVLVANSKALEAKGVTRRTEDPVGGKIERCPDTGEPTGVLRERAQHFLKPRGVGNRGGDMLDRTERSLKEAARRGVTTIHDIVVSADEVRAYQTLARQGRLPVRVHLLIRVIESDISLESLLDLGLQHGFGSDMLRFSGAKISIDGGFTGRQSAFSGLGREQGNTTLVRIPQDELDHAVRRCHEAGVRLCVHAIGDIALDMTLRAFESAVVDNPRTDYRHRVEHMGNWLYTEERIQRSKRLGLIPVTNPAVMYYLGDMAEEAIGPERMRGSFCLKTIAAAGLPVAGGSDAPGYWPVDVLRDIAVMVHRKTMLGNAISPEEAIDVKLALRAQTSQAAWLGFQEDRLGTLEPGKLADLIVLETDPLAAPAETIKDIAVVMAVVDGRVVCGGEQG